VAVAVDESGEIIGLAAAGVACDADAPTAWELYSINVLAAQQGGGLSDDLILAAAGNTDAVVWVAADNARAQGFYNRHGFKIDGAKRLAEDFGTAQMRMVRRLRALACRGGQAPCAPFRPDPSRC
jgi:ribosomal protein S18 acetylase RimI-like enzyme